MVKFEFEVFSVNRRVRAPRLSSLGLIGIVGAMFVYGTWQSSIMRQERRDQKAHKRLRRAFILPFLQAEEDVRFLRQLQKQTDLESYLMRDVEGWEAGKSTYHNGAIIPRNPRAPWYLY